MKKSFVLSIITAFSIPKVSAIIFFFLTLINPISAQEKNPQKVDIVRTTVNDDQVTLRVKVTGEGDRPVMGLSHRDFSLQVERNVFLLFISLLSYTLIDLIKEIGLKS